MHQRAEHLHHALRRNLDRCFVLVVLFVLSVFSVLLVFFMPLFFFVPVVRFAPTAFGPAAHHLGAQHAERARQVPHPRLVGVAPDDGLERVVADANLIRRQTAQRELQRQQVPGRDDALVRRRHEFELDDLADPAMRDRLKWAFSLPGRLRREEPVSCSPSAWQPRSRRLGQT